MRAAITLSPRDYDVVLFDLDGVLTRTASVHAAAWKKLFDGFLERRATQAGKPFVPFDIETDNCAVVLDAAGMADLFDARVDGKEITRLGLEGKPAPDAFLEAARRLGAEPSRAVGDILALEAGDMVAADARLLAAASLKTIEAALTGESEAVVKAPANLEPGELPLGDRENMVFMGTSVAAGTGRAVVVATAMQTEFGRIASLIEEAGADDETPLQRKLDAFGRVLVWAAPGVVALLFGIGLLRGTELLELLENSIGLAVAAVPEGLPAVLLGCNTAHLTRTDGAWKTVGDPTEGALLVAGAKAGADRQRIERELARQHELPFDSDRKRSTVIRRTSAGTLKAFTNGAPGGLLQVCEALYTTTGIRPLTAQDREQILDQTSRMARQGLRVLGAASRDLSRDLESASPTPLAPSRSWFWSRSRWRVSAEGDDGRSAPAMPLRLERRARRAWRVTHLPAQRPFAARREGRSTPETTALAVDRREIQT